MAAIVFGATSNFFGAMWIEYDDAGEAWDFYCTNYDEYTNEYGYNYIDCHDDDCWYYDDGWSYCLEGLDWGDYCDGEYVVQSDYWSGEYIFCEDDGCYYYADDYSYCPDPVNWNWYCDVYQVYDNYGDEFIFCEDNGCYYDSYSYQPYACEDESWSAEDVVYHLESFDEYIWCGVIEGEVGGEYIPEGTSYYCFIDTQDLAEFGYCYFDANADLIECPEMDWSGLEELAEAWDSGMDAIWEAGEEWEEEHPDAYNPEPVDHWGRNYCCGGSSNYLVGIFPNGYGTEVVLCLDNYFFCTDMMQSFYMDTIQNYLETHED